LALGAVAIALASATGAEHRHWQEAAAREGARYGIDPAYVAPRSPAKAPARLPAPAHGSIGYWSEALPTTFIGFGMVARVPQLTLGWGWVAGLTVAMLALLAGTGWLLWRTTRFN